MRTSGRVVAALVAGAALVTAACSRTPQQLSPTSPSAIGANPSSLQTGGGDAETQAGTTRADAPTEAGAVSPVTGTSGGALAQNGPVTDPSVVAEWAAQQPGWSQALETPSALEVEGTGPITAVSGACPSVVLTIYGIPVTVNASTLYGRNTTCARLTVGTVVRVRGLLTTTGGVTSVVAVLIDIEDDRVVEGEGRVLAVSGTCPTLTISVDGITVVTDAQTVFMPPSGCADIRIGTRVRVRGVQVPGGGSFRALSVTITGQRHQLEGEGRITSVTGTCPDLTIMIGTIAVQVNSATVYRGGSCTNLQPGVKIEARGFRDDGGPIIATVVEIKSRRVEGRGAVTTVTGTCPNLQLVVQGIRVVTNASTRFEDGSCAGIQPGTVVEIKGDLLTADGSVIAEEVEIEDQPGRGGSMEGEGMIGAVSGVCPARTIVVNGFTATTTAATEYRDGSCADLQPGRRVRARGEARGATIIVTRVEFR